MPNLGLKNTLTSESVSSAAISRETVSVSNSYHVDFPGSDDYIQVPSTLGSVIAPGSSWSVTAWIKYDDSGSGDDTIISTGDSSSRFFIRLRNSDGRIRVTADGGSTTKVYTSGQFTEDEWNHFAFVYTHDDSNELVYYRNGSAVGSAQNFDWTANPPATEVSDIYDTPGYVLTDIGDCALWYRMGDGTENGSGSTIYDMSNNKLNGTLQGDATIASGGID